MNKTRKTVLLAILVSQALVLSIIESGIPVPVPVYGVKLGLANIITIIVIVFFGLRETIAVVLARTILSSVFAGQGLSYFLFSIAGGLLSAAVMSLLYKSRPGLFSITGISLAGAVAHNIGQIIVAGIIMKDFAVAIYLPVLLVSGCITGFFVGLVSNFLKNALEKAKVFT
ncbi:MAG: Gx transporter family protein [Clostridiaceae bacterium]|nr:Gx transporter family protein [Clostridiaceae bacterium]